jgi:hypothetical protein
MPIDYAFMLLATIIPFLAFAAAMLWVDLYTRRHGH